MEWQGDMGMGESWGKKIPDWKNAKFKFWKICMESSRMRKKKKSNGYWVESFVRDC